mgnify:CR=1 FL=1
MDQGLNQKIDAYIAENKEQLLQDIAALVAIDSVEGTPEEGAPFGKGPRAALDKTLELAAGMGLATRNCENYIGYAELAGADPEKYLATICHVDVVPVGNGWTADPFTMRIQDGWLLGRGVADDKGPMVATLYALKFLKEQGYELRYPIRALIGDNEETHMNDVEYYLKNYPAPVFCFTPDAEFPVCNGEKGHFDGKLVSPVCNGVIKDFEGGDLFQACQPAEEVARTGKDAIRFGAMKPVGLTDPRTGRRPWAAIQLRAENKEKTAYNLVGFQTNLTFGEQKRVFHMVPGLENAEFFRYGVMHRNTFVDAPHVLDGTFAVPGTGVRLAGQITGTEGYMEAVATGLLAALNTYAEAVGAAPVELPRVGALGALVGYAADPATVGYQPMHVNFGLVPPLEDGKRRSKRDRYQAYADRALEALDAYLATRPDLFGGDRS